MTGYGIAWSARQLSAPGRVSPVTPSVPRRWCFRLRSSGRRSLRDPDLPVAIVGFEEVKSTHLLRHCLARVLEPLPGPGRQPNTRGDQKTSTPDMMEDDNIDQTDACRASGSPDM